MPLKAFSDSECILVILAPFPGIVCLQGPVNGGLVSFVEQLICGEDLQGLGHGLRCVMMSFVW